MTGRGAAKNLDWDCHPAQDDTRGIGALREQALALQELVCLRVLLNAIRDLFCGDLDALLGEVDVVGADVGGDVGIDG